MRIWMRTPLQAFWMLQHAGYASLISPTLLAELRKLYASRNAKTATGDKPPATRNADTR